MPLSLIIPLLFDASWNISKSLLAPSLIFSSSPKLNSVADIVEAAKGAAVIDKLPVSEAVAVVVPTMKLSALSSQAIIALLPVDPLSIRIPESLEAAPVRPWFNSTKLSVTARLVVFIVVVVPLTVRLPATTISLG